MKFRLAEAKPTIVQMSRPATARAQSETVGVILLLAVFVVSASAIGVAYVGGVGSDADEVVVSADLSADGTDLRVDHLGGDALPNDDLTVVVRADGNATRYPFAPPSGEFAPGDRRAFSDALVANASNEVRLYHDGPGGEIERATLTPEPDPTAETGAIEGVVVGPGASSMRVASGASLGLRRSVTPVAGARVAVDGAGRVAETTTGPGGVYRVEGLEPGEYEVSAVAPGLSVAAATAEVKSNETATVDLRLDPLAPAEFAVTIDDVDASVDAGEPVAVNATVENVGDREGTQTVELSVAGSVVDSETVSLAAGESRRLSLAWQPLPTDVGEAELSVASDDDEATTTVEVLAAETDAVAYVDRDADGAPEETFTATELAFLNDLDGRFVVFDDAAVGGSVAIEADRIVVETGVTLAANGIELVGADGVSLGDDSTLDASSGRLGLASAGDVTVRSGGDLDARGVGVTTAARAIIGASAGDIDVSAAGDVDVSEGEFDATGRALFGSDGTIRIASDGGGVTATGAAFAPEPSIDAGDE